MKDGIGQPISIGSKVVWVSGKTNYAGVEVYTVEKLTEKRVKVAAGRYGNRTYVSPGDLVVVDALLDLKKESNDD